MALVVEDGSGLSTAEAFISVADADAYWTAHGSPSEWTAADTAGKEVALRQGAAYLDLVYGLKWGGTRTTTTQALTWPRQNCEGLDGEYLDSDEIPQRLKDANCEAAQKYLSEGDLFSDVTAEQAGARRTRIKVGEIEEEVEYAGAKTSTVLYRRVHQLVMPFISASNTLYRG